MEHIVEGKAVRWTKRKHDRVFRSCCLQFKVELAAETFAQRQSPRAIEATAERRMEHQLHAAAVVEEPFENQILLRRHDAENNLRTGQILNNLFRSRS